MSLYPHEDQFLEEVFGLFTLEAQEWIGQCKTALEELEGQAPEERQDKLYESIICGVTNLGGSAATVELPVLEKLAFALVPLLQTMREHGARSHQEQYTALRAGLDEITLAICHLKETKNGTVPGFDQVLQRLSDAIHLPRANVLSQANISRPPLLPVQEAATIAHPALPLLDALWNLDRSRSESKGQTRHIIEVVINKVKAECSDDQSEPHIETSAILHILQDLEARDEQFLQDLNERLPTIERVLLALKLRHSDVWSSNVPVDMALQNIHFLHESARAVEAKAIMSFFHGLHAFLGILTHRGISVLPQRIDVVVKRLQSIFPMAEQWIEIGRHDRASVQKLLEF